MDIVITPHTLSGTVPSVSSKSFVHRSLLCAACAERTTNITCSQISEDIQATVECLKSLEATIAKTKQGFRVTPLPKQKNYSDVQINCKESGTTLRFMLPLLGGLGATATIYGSNRLLSRPLEPLVAQLTQHGMSIIRVSENKLQVSGQLIGGKFSLPGNISSQFISGLLLTAPLLKQQTSIKIEGKISSQNYIHITQQVMKNFGCPITFSSNNSTYTVNATPYKSPGVYTNEGDWSNAAPWLIAGALGNGVKVINLTTQSVQPDRSILAALSMIGARVSRQADSATVKMEHLRPISLSVDEICDLAPALAALAAYIPGTSTLSNIDRLHFKESDRVESICQTLHAFNVAFTLDKSQNKLLIHGGKQPKSCTVNSFNDHRIVMMATLLAIYATGTVTITHAEAINKSYPLFFEHFSHLGGTYDARKA